MASGTITGSGSYVNLKIGWSSTKGTGGSTVSATLYAVNNNYAYFYATVNQGYSITINGSAKSGTTATLSTAENGTSTLISSSVWVSYTGNKSITISGAANMTNIYVGNSALGNRSVSGTAALDKVGEKPPVPTVSAPTTSTISETATSIAISWAKSADYSGSATYTLQVSVNSGSYANVKSSISNGTTNYTYKFTAGQGNTYRFRVCAVNDIGTSDYSYSGTVTTNSLSAPTIGTLSTYNPYVTATLSVPLSGGSQTNGQSFMRMAALYKGSTKLATCTTPSNGNTTASISYSAINYATKIGTTAYSDKFTIKAWTQNDNGSTSSIVSKDFTVNLNSDGKAVPTLNSPILSGGFTGYTSTCFVAGKHNLTVTSGSASANRAPSGTTLSYSISCTGFATVNSNTNTFNSPTAGKKTITVTVTDSRGLSTSKTVYCRFQSWAKPTVKITSAERDETTPTTIRIIYTISYTEIYDTYGTDGDTAGTNINGIGLQQYTTNSTYNDCTSPITVIGTNVELGYTFTIRASDKISTTTYGTASRFVGTIDKYISYRKDSIGFGCVPNTSYRLDVKGGVRFYTDTGDVKFTNGNIYTSGSVLIPNGKGFYSYTSAGATHTLLAMGSNDNVALNYSGYNNSIGTTTVYGNELNLYSKNTIKTNTDMTINGVLNSTAKGAIIGTYRHNETWIGYYDSNSDAANNTNRRAYIGHSSDTSTAFNISNEKGGSIILRSYRNGSVVTGVHINENAFYPSNDASIPCGYSSGRWTNIYATNGTIQTSDRNHKKNINELDDRYIQLFNKLIPVSFEFNYKDSDRIHIGFISQDVEDAMNEVGISNLEFAGFCKDTKQIYNEDTEQWEDVLDNDGNPVYIYSLRYQEFIALNTCMIQKCMSKINELERRL